jgi:tetratricopeptide (TPR) repeat protein
MMLFRILKFVVALLSVGSPAYAAWHEASSDHFLVIADQNEKDVREFTERLERFHSAVLYVLGRDDVLPSPSNRVTIYVVRSARQVQKLAGDKSGFLQGFYQACAGGSVAFTSRVESEGRDVSQSEQILLHEYTHHIMHSASGWAMPRWLSEGYAEFFSTARFEADGGVVLGLPASQRADELYNAVDVSIEALLDSAIYQKQTSNTYDEFYGRSWLLYHYLALSGKRDYQITAYQAALANGSSELDAAKTAFGDLKLLEKELDKYLTQTMNSLIIPSAKLKMSAIIVRKMREAEAAITPITLESKRGVTKETAMALLPKAHLVAAKYPEDPAVLAALSEAENDAGNLDAALVAADKAISAAPLLVGAHVQKIYALSRIAENADDPDAASKMVRKAASVLNKIENDHPIPLIYYYKSLKASGTDITDVAAHGLERALQLAPYDQDVRYQLVQQLVDEQKYGLAYRTLMPLANDPHNRGETNAAVPWLAEIKQKWEEKIAEDTSDTNVKAEAAVPRQ